MASFLSKSFGHKGYAAFRPTYSAELYKAALSFHQASPDAGRTLAVDLGTGHGLVPRELSPHFDSVIGTDPSAGMIAQAREISTSSSATYPNVRFHQAAAESSPFLPDRRVNLVTAAQASHWSISWAGTSSMIANTVFQVLYGRLSDIFGRKKVYLSAVLLLAIADILCATAQTAWAFYL